MRRPPPFTWADWPGNRFPTWRFLGWDRRCPDPLRLHLPNPQDRPQATSAAAHVAPLPEDDDPLLAFAPYLHKQPRRNSITPDLQRRFVAQLAANGIVKQAARSIGKSIKTLYKLRARPGAEGFAAAWDPALRHGTERLEDCALERALKGGFDDDPVSGWGGRGNGLLIYLLNLRSAFRVDERGLRPGHPAYERIRREVLDEQRERERGTS